MSSGTELIPLRKANIPPASEMFARTFHNDPMMTHLLPNAAKRPSHSARSYQCLLRYGIHCGEVLATSANLEGVAIWLPPDAAHGSLAKLLQACPFTLPLTAGPSFFLRFLSYHQQQWSHVQVIWWFDQNDTPQKRSILQVHPRGDQNNPLTGVFACRAPVRPNLIGLSLCKVLGVKDNVVEVETIDAFEGTPVLDLKPFAPGQDLASGVKVPKWAGPK